jgi:hypothetical protein
MIQECQHSLEFRLIEVIQDNSHLNTSILSTFVSGRIVPGVRDYYHVCGSCRIECEKTRNDTHHVLCDEIEYLCVMKSDNARFGSLIHEFCHLVEYPPRFQIICELIDRKPLNHRHQQCFELLRTTINARENMTRSLLSMTLSLSQSESFSCALRISFITTRIVDCWDLKMI